MNRKITIKTSLISSLFLLALGGWLLHLRIHPLEKSNIYIIPFVSGVMSALLIPFLFCYRKTVDLAYILNGFLVIIGTITMAHFALTHFDAKVTILNIILYTTLADILILWGKFAVGKALYDLEFLKPENDSSGKGRFFRYPNMGWWWVHLFSLAALYSAGNIFLK